METRLRILAILLLTGAALGSCVDNVVEEPKNGDGTFTMSVTATKDAPTKALTENNNHTLTATWAIGEQVTVYNDSRKEALSGYLEAKKAGATTTLQGTLNGTIRANDNLTLKFLSPNYASQNGTLTGFPNSIDKVCDYAEASVAVASVDNDKITTTQNATFVNKQAVVKFTLKASDGTTPINATHLTVNDGTSTVSLSDIPDATYSTNGNGVLYVAFPAAGSAKTITLNVTTGGKHFVYEKPGVTFTNGKFYEISVTFGALPGAGTEASPYLISSVADWNYLANKVNSGNNYSGKFFRLDADINVTTMVGNSESNSFRGTFDGDGHTLTINYNTTSDYTAPFRYIQGATFKNLKVTGNITTTMNLAGGIAGLNTGSTATFEQCVTDIAITSSSTTIVGWGAYDYHGGFLARSNSANVNLTDCVCGGSVDGSSSSKSKCAGFVGVAENCTVSATRCLSTTSYTNVSSWNSLCHQAGANRTVNVFYYVNANDVGEDVGTQVTTSQLADGSYATALQAGRSTTVWVQYARTNQPMLKQFTKYTVTYNANGGSGSVPAAQAKQHGDDLALSNSTLTLGGFTHTGWNTNSDGSGTHYDIGGTYSANADVTLYAEWTANLNYTGAVQTITIPATGYYTLECYGAQGGRFVEARGREGFGGTAQLTYHLTAGTVLYIYVGGQGGSVSELKEHIDGGDGGWNGGGKGGNGAQHPGEDYTYSGGGGGGGATHIATSAIGPITSTTDFTANHDGLLLIAGGGGGGTGWGVGGNGGGATGEEGKSEFSSL